MNAARKKKIVIDARPLARPRSGIRRYLENIIVHLLEHQEVEWILYSDYPLVSDVADSIRPGKLRVIGPGQYARLLWGWKVWRWLKLDRPDVYWTPRHHLPPVMPGSIRKIVTIHDMVWVSLPETMRRTTLLAERLLTLRSLKQADEIIAVSRSTAADINQFLPDTVSKTKVISHGRTSLPKPSVPVGVEDDGYILSVGTIEPRKNFPRLIAAYSEYINGGGGLGLVIAGAKGWGWDEFEFARKGMSSMSARKMRFVENCSDENLSWLYEHAKAFVMVSLGEGYGLPVLEADSFGLPMILSDLGVFREHGLTYVEWMNPVETQDISNAFARIERAPRRHVKAVTLLPSWEGVSEQMLEVLLT